MSFAPEETLRPGKTLRLGLVAVDGWNAASLFEAETVFKRRAEWRGFAVRPVPIRPEAPQAALDADLLVVAGDDGPGLVRALDALPALERGLRAAADAGRAIAAFGGGYPLLGRAIRLPDGRTVPGAGLLPVITELEERYASGPFVGRFPDLGGEAALFVAFEHRRGRMTLEGGAAPLLIVLRGHGNNGQDRTEGARVGRIIGTSFRGSALAYQPALADRLLAWALGLSGEAALPPVDDGWAERARERWLRRLDPRGRLWTRSPEGS